MDGTEAFDAHALPALAALGFHDLQPLHQGKDARLFSAFGADGRKVAVRVVLPKALGKSRNRASLSNRLGQKLLELLLPRHPNLVRYRASGVLELRNTPDAGRVKAPYVVMDFVAGTNLRAALGAPEFSAGGLARIRTVALGILEGLAELHRRGLRHGDLGPPNVILEPGTWNPVIVDLRFSTHLGRRLDHDRSDIHRLLREMLAGSFDLCREPSPEAWDAALAYWAPRGATPAFRASLRAWMDFADALAKGGALGRAQPPEILKAAQRIPGE